MVVRFPPPPHVAAAASAVTVAAVISDPQARRLVHRNHYDRVTILPGRLDYALVPSTVYAQMGLNHTPNSSSIQAEENEDHEAVDADADVVDTVDAVADTVYLTVDDHLVYARFFADFGPLDLAQTVRFCHEMSHRLKSTATSTAASTSTSTPVIVLVSSDHPHKRANAMALLALFLVIVHKQTPRQAIAPFQSLRPAHGFRDAACGVASYFLTVFDCACAVHKAIKTGIWSYATFSLEDYEHYDQLRNGDINWILPNKILAFSGPQLERVLLDADGKTTTLLAHEYASVFQKLGVSCVVRFNEPTTYDRRAFLHANIRHLEMQYPDGGNPSDENLFKFIRTCERESGAVAVHCKAGLGRTGTNIAAYLMKTYKFSASEAIAWCRICRPGSIVGPQQQYLVVEQPQLWQQHQQQCLASSDDEKVEQQEDQAMLVAVVKKQSFPAVLRRLPRADTSTSLDSKRPPRSTSVTGASVVAVQQQQQKASMSRRASVAGRSHVTDKKLPFGQC